MHYPSFYIYISLSAILLGIGLTACGDTTAAPETVASQPAPVRVATAGPAEFLNQIRTVGRVEPDRTYVLAFKTPGVVSALTDAQLGAATSIVALTVGLLAVPLSLIGDRFGRSKSIIAMAGLWSVATAASAVAASSSGRRTSR